MKVIEHVDGGALVCRICGQRSWLGHTTYRIEGGIFSACNAPPVPCCHTCLSWARVRALVWQGKAVDFLTFKPRALSKLDHRAGIIEAELAPFVGIALYGLTSDQVAYVVTTWRINRRRVRKGPDGGGVQNARKSTARNSKQLLSKKGDK